MAIKQNIWKSISKAGTDIAKEGLKEVKKNKKKIIIGAATAVASAATSAVAESGFSFFSKPYYIIFDSLKSEDVENFKKQMVELGFKIQLKQSKEQDYSGKILNYFHSSKKADKFTYQLPLGLAEYHVSKLTE
jgi:hypothetical protein